VDAWVVAGAIGSIIVIPLAGLGTFSPSRTAIHLWFWAAYLTSTGTPGISAPSCASSGGSSLARQLADAIMRLNVSC